MGGGGGSFSLTPSNVHFLPLGCTLTVSTFRYPNFKLYITCQYNRRKDSWEGGGGGLHIVKELPFYCMFNISTCKHTNMNNKYMYV